MKVNDTAWIVFAKAFYNTLFSIIGWKVWEAFEFAKQAVEIQDCRTCPKGESQKFVLFSKHPDKICPELKFNLKTKNKQLRNKSFKFDILPPELNYFIGRHNECIEIIKALKTNRLISIEGPAGIGKSSIVNKISHLLFSRDVFTDGIVYLWIKDWYRIEEFFSKRCLMFWIFITRIQISFISWQTFIRPWNLISKILKLANQFTGKEALIILDNWDRLISEDYNVFKNFIVNILNEEQNLKIIITSKMAISDSVIINEWVFKIRGLSREHTLNLLKKKSPPNTEFSVEIKELMKESNEDQITNHPLFYMLNGHPLSTIILSSLRTEMSLLEIYDLLNSLKANKTDDNEQENTDTPLAISLSIEASLIFAKKANSLTHDILQVFSCLSSGLLLKDCIKIWEFKWYECENILLSKSLINK
jgi:hypothetical protein